MAEMKWNEMKTGGSGEGTPFLKLQPGINQIRIVDLPFETEIHWEDAVDGSKKKVVCPGVGCPICKEGHVPQKRFQVLVIDRTDSKIKILEGGVSIFKQIKDIAMDPDYGDPTFYDLKIKKEGQGRETKYSVLASPNKSQLSEEEKQLVANSQSLKEINSPKSIEEIMALGLEVLSGSDVGDFAGGWGEPMGTGENAKTITDNDDWSDL